LTILSLPLVGVKKEIVRAVEADRDAAFQARRDKRKEDEELKKKTQEQSSAGTQSQDGTDPPSLFRLNKF